MENNTEINKSSLVNILTLRYDPSIKPNLLPKSPKDFSVDESPVSIQDIDDSICGEMQNKLDSIRDKEISIALSGGVDSTLVLASLRKIKPEKKIHAVSIKFANSVDETPTASKIAEKFNAEYQENVNFNDNSFKFIKSGNRGINELAYHLTNGKLSYPMTIFLDENYKIITLLPGYHKPKFYKSVLTYIGDDYWKEMSWSDFTKVNY